MIIIYDNYSNINLETEFHTLVTEFPAIQIVPKDTPGARTKATDDATREVMKGYYSLGNW